MTRAHLVTLAFVTCALASGARAAEPAPAPAPPAQAASPEAAFLDVARVLQSPRCMNCHPNGNAPLQGDDSHVHAMGVVRGIERVGMTCQTCHRAGAVSNDAHMPPTSKIWQLPPEVTPMIFQGRTPAALCAQLKDPKQNGGHDLAHLVKHVTHDELVLYGWRPGAGRTVPPLAHDVFVARFTQWVDAGAPCPAP